MEKNTGKVREICQSRNVGTMSKLLSQFSKHHTFLFNLFSTKGRAVFP